MARARRKQAVSVANGEQAPMVRRMPAVGPLCEVSHGTEMQTHL
jgi:hypothetical protein